MFETPNSKPFFLSDAQVVPAERTVVSPSGTTRLEPRAYAVLERLVAADGAPVSREALLECWPETSGSDEAVTQAVWAVRRALGDTERPARLIKTVPKLGYVLVVAPRFPAAEADGRVPTAPATRDRSRLEPSLIRAVVRYAFLFAGLTLVAGLIGYGIFVLDKDRRNSNVVVHIIPPVR